MVRRRAFLASSASLLAATAGCLGDGGSEGTTGTPVEDETPDDGYPPEAILPGEPPSAADADVDSFDTVTTDGVDVPLVPAEVAYNWYQRSEARFVDARGSEQYRNAHIVGAVLSSARSSNDWSADRQGPTTDWPTGDRIVCYCGCPHHLSSLRAGEFITKGYESVFAIDEGFYEGWRDQDRPIEGVPESQARVVRGRTDPADAGEYAWAVHDDGAKQEAAPIQSDGSYELTLHFADLSPTSLLTVRTPSYEVTSSLADLTDGLVTGE